ncbi:peptide deformylase [Patescibacteria group bacterium]|nr:peptide deformylase [Patescibacteria group bacterium]MBU4455635.1 peptide deformylase [Patescibacteria group bacterium]MCG2691155.1 peptide deformylase [Candidatus Parcubacteria bacterium]
MSSKAKILPIITIPNPILKKKSAEVEPKKISSKELQELCLNMEKTMKDKKGVGIAAPQIGKNIRLIIINTKDGGVVMFNPKIIRKSLTKEWGEEGCFSVPDVFGQVKRHKKIECEYLDKTGKKIKIKAEGLMARVIQHEIDHLDGILFIDKAVPSSKIRGGQGRS